MMAFLLATSMSSEIRSRSPSSSFSHRLAIRVEALTPEAAIASSIVMPTALARQ